MISYFQSLLPTQFLALFLNVIHDVKPHLTLSPLLEPSTRSHPTTPALNESQCFQELVQVIHGSPPMITLVFTGAQSHD